MSANANQEILDRLSSLERANENLKKDLENNVLQLRNESVIFQRDIQKDTLQRHIDNSQLREMMQSRLVDLERKTEEIELLKTKNGQLERENQQITDRLVAMEEVVTSMGSNLAQVAEARDNIHDRLTQLEDQTHVKESNDRVNAVQSAVNSLRQDMTSVNSCHRTLSETVDTLQLRQKSTKGMFDDRLQILKTESEELHQSLSTSLDTTQRQVDGRLQRLEAGSQEIHQTMTNSLETTQRQVDDSIKNSEEKVEHRLTSVLADFDDRLQIQKTESEELHQSLSTSLDTTQRQVEGRLQRLEAGSQEIHQTMTNSLETTQRKVHDSIKDSEEKVEHRLTSVMAYVDDSIKNSEEKVEHRLTSVLADTTLLGKEVVEINNMNNTFRQSVTAAWLLSAGGLVDRQWVKVDKCLELEGSPGMVDKATGCLVPKRKGRYVVGLMMAQRGDGEILVNLKWDGADVGRAMVRTVQDNDVKSGLRVMEMEEGGKYWLEAARWKGTAEIKWCNVYCWFLSPC